MQEVSTLLLHKHHAEATCHAHRLAQSLRQRHVQAGIAINPGTPISVVEPVLDQIDMILVMTVNPGWGGQAFIDSALNKVAALRAQTDLPIEVDGGIDPLTIRRAYDAGATVFVTGSYLARSGDIGAAMSRLRTACSD